MSLDLSRSPHTLAEALYESSRDCGRAAEFQEIPSKSPPARLHADRPHATQIQMRFPGFDLPPMLRPEKRPWPKPAPSRKPKARYKAMRGGVRGGEFLYAMTYAEIAKALDISHERVRQLEKNALRKCRAAFERLGISADILIDVIRGAR